MEELPPENVTIEMMEHRLSESGRVCSGSPMEGDWQKSPADMSHDPHTGEDSGIHTLVKIAHGRNGNAHLES